MEDIKIDPVLLNHLSLKTFGRATNSHGTFILTPEARKYINTLLECEVREILRPLTARGVVKKSDIKESLKHRRINII